MPVFSLHMQSVYGFASSFHIFSRNFSHPAPVALYYLMILWHYEGRGWWRETCTNEKRPLIHVLMDEEKSWDTLTTTVCSFPEQQGHTAAAAPGCEALWSLSHIPPVTHLFSFWKCKHWIRFINLFSKHSQEVSDEPLHFIMWFSNFCPDQQCVVPLMPLGSAALLLISDSQKILKTVEHLTHSHSLELILDLHW